MMLSNSEPKRMNLSEESFNADIISNLPDSILSQILCFLPTTKEVVATTILSKRWRYVWTSVDKLVFKSFGYGKGKMNITQFVYRVLKFHQGNIKDLELYCRGHEFNEFDVTSWINTAIARGVERLNVSSEFNWPLSIFTCKTLVDLKMMTTDRDCTVPSPPIFPCLKKLHVPYLYFDTKIFKHIVSQCSALEHLIVDSWKTPIEIVSSSVKRLELHFTQPLSYNKKIVLDVPFLQYLQIDCTLPFDFVVEEQLSSLVEADIYFRDLGCSGNINIKLIRYSFGRFIQHLSNVKVLRIDCDFQRFLNCVGHGQFLNLTKLEIVSPFFEWRLLVTLMETAINLEAITLKKTSTAKRRKLVWKAPKIVPSCLSSALRKIAIDGYSEDELPMVEYVLRNAQILEQMDIHFANYYRNKLKSHMFQKIQMLHRACARCEISLVEETLGCSLAAKWECTSAYHVY